LDLEEVGGGVFERNKLCTFQWHGATFINRKLVSA
jgi:hypothetical protein